MGETHLCFLGWTSWHDRLHRRLLMQPQLLPQGSALLLAVSGGQDSMAPVSYTHLTLPTKA